jgi:hypothetical protein
MTQCWFQEFYNAVYETVALMKRRFRSEVYVRTAQNIEQFTSTFGHYVVITQSVGLDLKQNSLLSRPTNQQYRYI